MFSTVEQPPEQTRVLNLTEAAALGYHISQRDSHLILRCPYSSPLSQSVKVHKDDVVHTRLLGLHHSLIKWMLCVGVDAFSPGERSGFRDCQSYRPVQTPKQLPGC